MRVWQLLVGLALTVGLMILAVAAYYALSFLVLTITGRLLPLAGRRRRRD